jgi:ribosomal protein L11 methylase PrmA
MIKNFKNYKFVKKGKICVNKEGYQHLLASNEAEFELFFSRDNQQKIVDLLGEAKGNCDLIVANITADILLRLMDTVSQYMKKGSKIILSGILNARLQEVKTSYEGIGLVAIDSKTKGEWSCLVMEKL